MSQISNVPAPAPALVARYLAAQDAYVHAFDRTVRNRHEPLEQQVADHIAFENAGFELGAAKEALKAGSAVQVLA